MKKVIVKVKLKNHEEFVKKLKDIGFEFSAIIWQHDRVSAPKEFRRGMNYPRIAMRTEMKAVDKPAKYLMILKRHIEDSGVNVVDETVVKDYVEAVNIAQQLGFRQMAEVSRRRQELVIDDGVKLYLDKVENVPGFYAKLESVVRDGEKISAVFEDLEKTLKAFGATDIVDKPYFELLKK